MNYYSFKTASYEVKKDYKKLIDEDFNEKKWNIEGKGIAKNINQFQVLMGKLSKKINEAKNLNLNDPDIEDMIDKVKEEIESAKDNIEPMIRKMKEKISHFACDFGLAAKNEQRENEKKEQQMVLDLTNNEEKRIKDLQDIHDTYMKIKEISDHIALVKKQGEILNEIENEVIEAEDNAQKAKKEILDADKMSKSNKKESSFL